MPQHYYPARRLAYHVNGTRVFYRRRRYVQFSPEIYDVQLDYNEIPLEGRTYLNLERRSSLTFDRDGTHGAPGVGFPFSQAWEIVFYFAQPVDLAGMYFVTVNLDEDSVPAAEVLLSTSKNTTGLDDGEWSESVPMGQSTTRAFDETTDAFVSGTEERKRYRIWRLDPTQPQEIFVTSGADVMGSYRGTFEEDGYGIHTFYGEEYRGVRALRVTTPGGAFSARTNIHLYGRPTDEPVSWGVDIVNADSSELSPNDLVFGDIVQQVSDDVTLHTLPGFRVRNYSDSKTAEDVTLVVTQPDDQMRYTLVPQLGVSLMVYVSARIDGGAWQTYSFAEDTIVLTLPDLSPGEESPVIEVRMSTTVPSFGVSVLGPGNLQFQPQVGAWS